MTRPPASRPRSRVASQAGSKASRALTGVLVAFTAALLLRPVLLVLAALGDEQGDGFLPALVAAVFHIGVFALALSLFLRSRRGSDGR